MHFNLDGTIHGCSGGLRSIYITQLNNSNAVHNDLTSLNIILGQDIVVIYVVTQLRFRFLKINVIASVLKQTNCE